jgi:hypothetical protein
MKKFLASKIKKILTLAISLFLLNSCAVTEMLWEPHPGYEELESFFIDNETNRIVLIGEAGYATKQGTYYYSLTDKSGNLFKIFEIGLRSNSDIYSGLSESSISGSNVRSNLAWVSFKTTNLSEEDKNFLDEFNESQSKKNAGFAYYFGPYSKITRYPSSKEKFRNICSEINRDPNCSPIIKLGKPWKGRISNAGTVPGVVGKLIITPFAIVTDIILSPVYATVYIMANKPHDSQSSE